ncbi:MAG: phytanoyl-CoA dioxygenase family protein [Proteobacteria bacterium]|nr:phytanoyl-CoA dioxygenase family protein [Pseudomonadota bacterium]
MIPERTIQSEYNQLGYYFPLNVLSEIQANDYGHRLAVLSQSDQAPVLGYRGQLNHLHVVCPYVNEIVRNSVVIDAVETILGPDILVWGVSLFLKPSHSPGYVSWHQDLTYWGLSNDQEVSAWFALGPVTRDNGCMRFVPGSHKLGQIEHQDTVNESNILTRGQHADIDIDESSAVYVELEAGQVSLHHGYLLHASGPNNTDQPRIGLSVNYLSTSVRQSVAKTDFAMLVRGEDRYNHFEQLPEPKGELDDEGMEWHRKIIATHNEALYDGAENTDSAPKL